MGSITLKLLAVRVRPDRGLAIARPADTVLEPSWLMNVRLSCWLAGLSERCAEVARKDIDSAKAEFTNVNSLAFIGVQSLGGAAFRAPRTRSWAQGPR
jgi:hypothetical protein